ncbi:putative multidrug resistance-associated protein lethal(2)03659 [Haematobia irritans]|uniref:putative multidrug resistance-associated protein lethal(2)03659 n=1 Tax=Haematobia irritans TaxID=7368 RepID=UPI003F501C31
MQSFKADELPENPRESANPLSALMFCFTMPTFFKGRKKDLDERDLYRALDEHKSDYLGHKLSQAWEEEVSNSCIKNKEPSLIKATMKVFGLRYMSLGVLMFLFEIFLRLDAVAWLSTPDWTKHTGLGELIGVVFWSGQGLVLANLGDEMATWLSTLSVSGQYHALANVMTGDLARYALEDWTSGRRPG